MGAVFISYRRSDSTPYAVSLANALRQAFGSPGVFLDTTGMIIGQQFPDRLRDELNEARVCLVVIGPDWLDARDENGDRRIRNPNDWVHREARLALERGIAVPVLVSNAKMPGSSELPEPLRALTTTHAITLDDARLGDDLRRLVAELSTRFQIRLTKPDIVWPAPDKTAHALTPAELSAWIKSRQLPGEASTATRVSTWSIVNWRKEDESEDGTALLRSYRFRSFEDAIHFMATASRFITRKEHHPAWTNIWRTVTVRLTTFDIGYRPSVYDLRLAEYLDHLYRDYTPWGEQTEGRPSGPLDRDGPSPNGPP